MATGGYRSAGGSTTDFLEEWKAKREKMRAKQAPPAPGAVAGGEARPAGAAASAELNNNRPQQGAAAGPRRGPRARACRQAPARRRAGLPRGRGEAGRQGKELGPQRQEGEGADREEEAEGEEEVDRCGEHPGRRDP